MTRQTRQLSLAWLDAAVHAAAREAVTTSAAQARTIPLAAACTGDAAHGAVEPARPEPGGDGGTTVHHWKPRRQLLTFAEAGDVLGCKARKVRQLVDDSLLPSVYVGRLHRIALSDIEDYIERLRAAPRTRRIPRARDGGGDMDDIGSARAQVRPEISAGGPPSPAPPRAASSAGRASRCRA